MSQLSASYPGLKPSLNLDFARTKTLDPRITFARASTATFYDGVTVAKAEENIFTNSATITNTFSGTVNNGDGTYSFSDPATGVYKTRGVTTASDVQFTVSCDLSGTGEVRLTGLNGSGGAIGSDIVVTLTATPTRYSWTGTNNTSGVNCGLFVRGAAGGTAATVRPEKFQLEFRSTATAYTATTTQPITNYIPVLRTAAAGVARFDHNPVTGESLGLLIEEQQTNLMLQTENPTITWAATVLGTSTRVLSGWNIGFNVFEITATSANGGIRQVRSSLSSGQVYTLSFYMKSTATIALLLENAAAAYGTATGATINGATGVISSVVGFTSTASTPFGGGYLYTFVLAAAGGSLTANIEWRIVNSGDRIFLGRPQFEAGAFATSYIPTVASSVTRSADNASMTGTNFSSWYRADEGTVYVEAQPANRPDLDTASTGTLLTAVSFGDALTNQYSILTRTEAGTRVNRAATYFRSALVSSNIEASGNNTYPNNSFTKMATAMKAYDYAFSASGETIVASNSPDTVIGTRLNIGGNYSGVTLNGTIKRIAYYPARLTNAQLQTLTT